MKINVKQWKAQAQTHNSFETWCPPLNLPCGLGGMLLTNPSAFEAKDIKKHKNT